MEDVSEVSNNSNRFVIVLANFGRLNLFMTKPMFGFLEKSKQIQAKSSRPVFFYIKISPFEEFSHWDTL